MFCKNCGKQLSDEALMCPECGTPTGYLPTKKNSDISKETNNKGCSIVTAGFVLSIIGFVSGIIFYSLAYAGIYATFADFVLIPAFSGLALDIIGLNKAQSSKYKGLAISGIVLAGIVLLFVFLYCCIAAQKYRFY